MKKLFSNENYLLLFQGSFVSAIGTSLYGFAAGMFVQDMYRDINPGKGATYLSLFMFVSIFVMVVFSPLAGVLVDKWNKIRILYITDWIRGFLFVGTYFVLQVGFEDAVLINLLLLITFLTSLNQAFFSPASASVIPEVVGEELIQQANGANSIIQSAQTIVGVILGVVLYEYLGFALIVLVNAISFMFSAISEMFIRTKYKSDNEPITFKSFGNDFKIGLKFIKSKEGFLTMMMFSLVLNFAFTPLFSVGIPYLFRTELGASVLEIGIQEIAFSVAMLIGGMTVGAMVITDINKSVKNGIISLTISFIVSAVFIILVSYNVISYWTFYFLFIGANVFLAITMMFTNVPLNTAMMKAIDPEIRGRVFGTIGAISQGAIPFAILLGGQIIRIWNTAALGLFCSVLVMGVSVMYIKNKKITNMLNSISTVPRSDIHENETVFE